MNEATQLESTQSQPRKRRKLLFILLILILLTGGGIYGYYEFYGQYYETTDDAYVQGNLNTISPQINGTVTKVYVENGDRVKKGQPLVQLDRNQSEISLAQSEAHLANVVRQTRGLYNDITNYQAQVKIKQVDYK